MPGAVGESVWSSQERSRRPAQNERACLERRTRTEEKKRNGSGRGRRWWLADKMCFVIASGLRASARRQMRHTALCCYATLFQTPAAHPFFLPASTPTPTIPDTLLRLRLPNTVLFRSSSSVLSSAQPSGQFPSGRTNARESLGQCARLAHNTHHSVQR